MLTVVKEKTTKTVYLAVKIYNEVGHPKWGMFNMSDNYVCTWRYDTISEMLSDLFSKNQVKVHKFGALYQVLDFMKRR